MTAPRFCDESSLWIPSTSTENEGAFGYRQWKRLLKRKKRKPLDFIVWITPILIAGLLIYKFTATEVNTTFDLTLLSLSAAYLLLSAGIHIYFVFS